MPDEKVINEGKSPFSLHLPVELKQRVEKMAGEKNTSMTELIISAIEKFIDSNKCR